MSFTKIEDVDGSNRCRFSLEGVDASIANALRRTLISGVPTIAIERINVLTNTSKIEDETISHMVGLVPLCSQRALPVELMPAAATAMGLLPLPFPGECGVCSGGERDCDACGVSMRLYAKGPKLVTTLDIESDDPTVTPAHLDPPIAFFSLAEGEELRLDCVAHKGIGSVHSKWSPVCPVRYRQDQERQQTFGFDVSTTGAIEARQAVAVALVVLRESLDRLATLPPV